MNLGYKVRATLDNTLRISPGNGEQLLYPSLPRSARIANSSESDLDFPDFQDLVDRERCAHSGLSKSQKTAIGSALQYTLP
jgi:hypothetical protein